MMDIKWTHLERVLNEFADYFIEEARRNLDENDTNASYELYNSFETIIDVGQDYFKVSVSLADYWKYVENGRGPGRYPPIDKIREWVEVKPVSITPGMNGRTPSVEQVSFLIARKIANEGTEAQPFFEPAKEKAIDRFNDAINEAIMDDVYDYIDELIIERMKDTFGK